MADISKLVPFILKWEGGFVNDKDDRGGATNRGVTLKTFRRHFGMNKTVDDLKRMTDEQFTTVLRSGYWDECHADRIENQNVANALVDFAWHSGPGTAIRRLHKVLGMGDVSTMTMGLLCAINESDPKTLFDGLRRERLSYLSRIATANPSQQKFLAGWRNRVLDLKFV